MMDLTPRKMQQKSTIEVKVGTRLLAPGGEVFSVIQCNERGFLVIDLDEEEWEFQFESLQEGWEVLSR
jgi:hypothetical protein